MEYRSKAGLLLSDQTQFPPYCLRIERRGDSTGNNYGVRQDSIPVTGGQAYTISCWLRADTIPDGSVHSVAGRVVVTWRGVSGGSLGSSNPGCITSADWTQQIYVDTAPDTAVMASVMIRCYGRSNPKSTAGGLIYADQAEFFLGASVAEEAPSPLPRAGLRVAPNPFGSQTALSYAWTGGGVVHLWVYYATGQAVRKWTRSRSPTGEVQWDGRDEDGNQLPGGLYFAVFEQGERQLAVRKVLLLR